MRYPADENTAGRIPRLNDSFHYIVCRILSSSQSLCNFQVDSCARFAARMAEKLGLLAARAAFLSPVGPLLHAPVAST